MANTKLYKYLVRLMKGENLSLAESVRFFNLLTDENANAAQIAGILTALTVKGETPEELAGMTSVIRKKAITIKSRHQNFINTAGTGSPANHLFNISTGAAFVTAGAGLAIAKQSNRRALNSNGKSNILGSLGIKVSETAKIAKACLNGAGICFVYAPNFHPALKIIGGVRRKLGINSCLKLLGSLSNPAAAPHQLIGVGHPSLIDPIAKTLAILGTSRAWVVHSSDGLDELTITGETFVAEIIGNKVRKFKISPKDFGLKEGKTDHLRTDNSEDSAEIIKTVLMGERRDEARTMLVINSAAALLIAGFAKKPILATRLAEQSIFSNAAQVKLERLIQTTNKRKFVSEDQ